MTGVFASFVERVCHLGSIVILEKPLAKARRALCQGVRFRRTEIAPVMDGAPGIQCAKTVVSSAA